MFIVRKLSQSFVIHNPPPGVVHYLNLMVNSTLKAPKLKRDRGKIYTEDGDHYYFVDVANNDHYYHIRQFDMVAQAIEMSRRSSCIGRYKIIEYSAETRVCGKDIEFKNYKFDLVVPNHDPYIYEFYGWQNEVSAIANRKDRDQTIFEVQTGRGKSIHNDDPVLTPTGWLRIGDIRVGDFVIGSDGRPTIVLAVFPQRKQPVYEVTTEDGRTVRTCGGHLWTSFRFNTSPNSKWKVRTTLEIKEQIERTRSESIYIPLPKPVIQIPYIRNLKIDPYVMGVYIADGAVYADGTTFKNNDIEVIERVKERLPEGHMLTDVTPAGVMKKSYSVTTEPGVDNLLDGYLSIFGIREKRVREKTIPRVFMHTTVKNRWELLRGLLDTNGTVNKLAGQPRFCTSSLSLAKCVQELAQSLGAIAKITSKVPVYYDKGKRKTTKEAYYVLIRIEKPSDCFHLERKKVMCIDDGQYNNRLKARIKSITHCGSSYTTCIKVAAEDELFITKDYMVTHNTKCFQKVMVGVGKRTLIITKPSYTKKWYTDNVLDETALVEDASKVRMVTGIAGIEALIEDAKCGVLDESNTSTIIIGTNSLKMWLEARSKGAVESKFPLYEFYEILGVGLVGYDEIHEHFHTIYLAGIVLNPPKTVEMSATLKPGKSKEFIRSRYLERFPLDKRVNVPHIKVCKIAFIYYQSINRQFNKYINGLQMYSHNEFENKIYSLGLKEEYFAMVYDIYKLGFFKEYERGQRGLIFFSLRKSCTDFTEYMRRRMKEDKLPSMVVNRYTGEDKYEDLLASDIAISTPGKAGTAVDLPGLKLVVVTTAIDDRQLNEQIAGRPRRLKDWPDLDPSVYFLHCQDLNKHNKYLASRQSALSHVAKSLDVVSTDYILEGTKGFVPNKSKKFNGARVTSKVSKMLERNKRRGFKKRKGKFKPKKGFRRW